MMTRKIFWEDPYRTALDTTITSVQGPEVTVAATIFFAFSGGQESVARWLPGLTAGVNDLVRADLPITSAFEDEALERRYWDVAGFARVPCGGTHPRRTGEVGMVRLKRNNIGGGKERIEIYID